MKPNSQPVFVSDESEDFFIDDIKFKVLIDGNYTSRATDAEGVVLLKSWKFMELLLEELGTFKCNQVLELGIWQGGSAILWPLLTDLRKYVGIDLQNHKFEFPERVLRHPRFETVRLFGETSQDDRKKLTSILSTEFDGPLDLVVDDASHQYMMSKSAFEILFPRLAPGGVYVIEDWSWAHNALTQSTDHYWAAFPALTNLIFELILLAASEPGIVSKIKIFKQFTLVWRGPAELGDDFCLKDCIRIRDRTLGVI